MADVLRELYDVRKMGMESIASLLGVSYPTIRFYLTKCGIHIRSPREAAALHTGTANPAYELCKTPEHRAKLSAAQKRRFANGAAQWNTGKKLSSEHRARIEAAKAAYRATHVHPLKGRTGRDAVTFGRLPPPTASRHATDAFPVTDDERGAPVMFRSLTEGAFALALATLGVRSRYESLTIDLGNFTYTPDFDLVDDGWLVELKGTSTPMFRQKIEALKEMRPDIRLAIVPAKKAAAFALGVIMDDDARPESISRSGVGDLWLLLARHSV